MSRIYQVSFSAVTVSAAQDLVLIVGPSAGKIMRILRVWLGLDTTSLPTGQSIALRGRLLPATVTVGSGGTTGITPSKTDQGDATCSSTTCGANNTTKSTTNGTAVVLYTNGRHIYQGDDFAFPKPPIVQNAQAFVYELLSTVTGTCTFSGGVTLEEIG